MMNAQEAHALWAKAISKKVNLDRVFDGIEKSAKDGKGNMMVEFDNVCIARFCLDYLESLGYLVNSSRSGKKVNLYISWVKNL